MYPVRKNASGGNLLRARDNDAVVPLFDYSCVESRVALLVCGFAAVDLRRHDRVAEIEVVVANELVESNHIICEVLSADRKDAWNCCIPGEKGCHVVWGPPH